MLTDNNDPSTPKIGSTPGPSSTVPSLRFLRRQTWIAISVASLILAVFASVLWLAAKATTISTQLNETSSLIPRLKDEVFRRDAEAASRTISELKEHSAEARQAAADPLWTIAGGLPLLGSNFQAVTTIATSADDVAKLAAAPLVSVAQSIDWKTLVPSAKGIELEPLAAAKPKLLSAAHAVSQSSERLNSIDAGALLPQISEPLVKARAQLDSLQNGLDVAADAAALAPDMLGDKAPRNYLLLIQNNAETRATGGIPGALAVMRVDHGKLALDGQTSASELGAMSPTIPVEPEQRQIYSGRVGKYMQDVNLTPDFPTSASVAIAMWQQKTGERLDGVVSVDPVALSYLLGATGPLTLSDPQLQELVSGALPTTLNQTNVVKTLLSDVYAEVPEPALQDLYFARVAEEIFGALSSGKNDNKKMMEGISRGVAEGRVLLWSASSAEQSVIAKYPVGGSISAGNISPAQFGVYFNDGTGAKMDYYVKRTVQMVKECTSDGYAQTKVRVTSTNTAPKDASTSLPAYVTGGGAFGVPQGTVQTNILAYGPIQSNVETAFVAGKKVGFASHRHGGRPVGAVTVRLAPGQSNVVEFTFGKIVQHTEPKLAVTPTVQALTDVVLDTIPAKCAPVS